jgi:hypothetical protein
MSCMVLVINSTILSRLFIYITLYVHGPVVETWSPGHVLRDCKSLMLWDCLWATHRGGRDIEAPSPAMVLRSMINWGKVE